MNTNLQTQDIYEILMMKKCQYSIPCSGKNLEIVQYDGGAYHKYLKKKHLVDGHNELKNYMAFEQ